jgi:hypothetical protein
MIVLIFWGQVFCGEVPWSGLTANAIDNYFVEMQSGCNLDSAESLLWGQVTKRVKQLMYFPFCFRILAVSANPMSVAGPRYLPRVNFSLGNVIVFTVSQNITQLYQANSQICLMSAVPPFMMVSGTSPPVA